MQVWYVVRSGAAVTWGTAVVAGLATQPIYQLARAAVGGPVTRTLWAPVGAAVPAAVVSAAQAATSPEPIPAPVVDQNPGASLKATPTGITALRQWDFDVEPTVAGEPLGAGGGIAVGPTNPHLTKPGIWVQTGLGADGTGITFWFEDGLS